LITPLRTRVFVALLLGAVAAAVAVTPGGRFLERTGVDVLLWLRHVAVGPLFAPAESPTAVVVIDEETYGTEPLSGLPQVAWTPQLGAILKAIDEGGAKVVGLDLVYPTTLEPLEYNGGRPLLGYDKPLRRAMLGLGRSDRLVLGEIDSSRQAIRPEPGQIAAAGGPENLRTLQLVTDLDNVVREGMGSFRTEAGETVTTMSGELARRAGAPAVPERFLINYNTADRDLPVYGFADLWRCAEEGKGEFFRKAFAGKIVLVGTALDVEDRRIPARQYLENLYRGPTARCTERAVDAPQFGDSADRRTVPGVFIHAAAVNTLMLGRPLRMLGDVGTMLAVGGFVALATLGFLFLSPAMGVAALVAGIAVVSAGSLAAFLRDLVLPFTVAIAALLVAAGAVYLIRFIEELQARRRSERSKRELSQRFGRYLAPHIIAQLEDNPHALRLGGDRRRVTIFFSDIVGYTTISEKLQESPEKLVEIVNAYFTLMVEIIERHGGYVDKFIGDAVMAVWGAPLEEEKQEAKAVEAALACCEALIAFNRDVVEGQYGLPHLGARIGLNTGFAIVGNMGSPARLNYTVTGDTVNLASRLEGANKAYGTLVMVGPETADAVGEDFVLRQLDLLMVKGKKRPVRVYEVIGRRGAVGPEAIQRVQEFNTALAAYNARRFAEAEHGFARHAADDPVSALYLGRCRHYLVKPPPGDWDGSFELTEK
jgi:class 3 adenylate cyclase